MPVDSKVTKMSSSTIEKLKSFQYVERQEATPDNAMESSSPQQSDNMYEDINAQLQSGDSKLLLSAISRMHQDFKSEIYVNLNIHESRITANENNLQALHHTVVSQEKTIHDLKRKVQTLEKNNESQILFNKRMNLVFEGVPEATGTSVKEQIKTLLLDKMKLNIEIEDAFRRGYATQKNRPIVVVFRNTHDKIEVLKRTSALSNHTPKIWVNEDMPPAMREEHRKLTPLVKIARHYDTKAHVKRGKLNFKGLTYSVQQSYQLPFIDEVGIRETDHRIYFFGRYSKFSNFYPSKINNSGVTFPTVEHLYQFAKAKFHNADDTAAEILKEQDPKNAKRLGDRVKERPEWRETAAIDVMKDALKAKFRIPSFKQLLIQTDVKTLVEASPRDNFWGIGMGLDDAIRSHPRVTSLNNRLGHALMEIRESLQ